MLRDPALIPLSHQHQHALALCVQIDRAMAVPLGADTLQVLAEAVSQHFDSEMRTHFSLEEQVLFPALSGFETTRELVRNLLDEHRTLQGLREALGQNANRDAIAEFSRLLRVHVRKEEGVLFEEAQRLLPSQQLAEIGRQLAAIH